MGFMPYDIYTPYTLPDRGEGGVNWAFVASTWMGVDMIYYYNTDASKTYFHPTQNSYRNVEECDFDSNINLGTMFIVGTKRHEYDDGTYGRVVGCHRKVYCDFNTGIAEEELLLIPFSNSGDTIEIGTEDYGEALADKRFLTGSTSYGGYPVISPCVGINNSCEDVITVRDEVGNYTIAKNTTTYSIPRRYYTGEIKANNSIRLNNTSTAERIITITKNGTVVGTVNVAAGATGYISLGDYNPNDKLVLTSEEAKTKAAHIYVGGEWKDAQAKVYVSGAWKDCTAYVYKDGAWHTCS